MPINNVNNDFFKEVNYDAKRHSSTLKMLHLSTTSDFLPNYPLHETLINHYVTKVHIIQQVRMIQRLYKMACDKWVEIINYPMSGAPADLPDMYFDSSPEVCYTPDNKHFLHFYTEEMVYHMRRVLDTLVQLTYVMATPDFVSTKILSKDSLASILNVDSPRDDFERILLGDGIDYESDNTNFLSCINSIFNSFKHGFYNEQTYMLFSHDAPTTQTFYIKKDLNKQVIFHNHNTHHIMMGFQDNFCRIIKNQKTYLGKQAELSSS
ncbi:hypothetical protein N1Z88_000753 [Citrobacter amalonaticus]|nr:hypothetical protein [Citrobacter amalonaticus]